MPREVVMNVILNHTLRSAIHGTQQPAELRGQLLVTLACSRNYATMQCKPAKTVMFSKHEVDAAAAVTVGHAILQSNHMQLNIMTMMMQQQKCHNLWL
jgi:hypothetical protein